MDQHPGEFGPVEPEGPLQCLGHHDGRAPGVVVPQPHLQQAVEEGVDPALVEGEGDEDGEATILTLLEHSNMELP